MNKQLKEVSVQNPCAHCGKNDWCYTIGKYLSVCKREAEPATGWRQTSKKDKEGSFFYALLEKSIRPAQTRIWDYLDRDGNQLVRIGRIDDGKGGKPIRWQESWNGSKWVHNLKNIDRSTIPIYKYAEIQKAIAEDQLIFLVEGEPCCDAIWQQGLIATTNIGGSAKWRDSDTKDLKDAKNLILVSDRDQVGVGRLLKLTKIFPQAKWLLPLPQKGWDDIPEDHGLDIADWINEFGARKSDILAAIKPPEVAKLKFGINNDHASVGEEKPVVKERWDEQIFTQLAQNELYADRYYVSIGGILYKFNGIYYQEAEESLEKRRIRDWCNEYVEQTPKGEKHLRANSRSVQSIWEWVISGFAISPSKVNPPGLNCQNGILRISWIQLQTKYPKPTPKPTWELFSHDPSEIYTYVSDVVFDPLADRSGCDRLLEALNPNQRKIFLQTAAAALDLKTIRKYKGRMVKMLLCVGGGNNGKDSLRSAFACVLGNGMTSASLSDFQSYDMGRKFPLTKLEGSLCNWASENSSFANLNTLQSIKQFGTGDPLDIERKNKDSYEIFPSAIGFFNCNEAPILKGGLEAVESRWAVLHFEKTFTVGADPTRGELEADPRFKYDPDYLKTAIAPALLNLILEELESLLINGIDYSSTKEAFKAIQESSCHLWQFCNELGIEPSVNGKIFISELWEMLKTWYVETGILEVEQTDKGKEKFIWQELAHKSDKPIKATNQIFARFSELFPKINRLRETSRDSEKHSQVFLSGISVKIASPATPARNVSDTCFTTASPVVSGDAVGEAMVKHQTYMAVGGVAGEAVLGKIDQKIISLEDFAKNLSPTDQAELCRHLVNCLYASGHEWRIEGLHLAPLGRPKGHLA